MMEIASNGHFLTQIPQPIHNSSEMNAILEFGSTSIHNFPIHRLFYLLNKLPIRTTGHDFLHSCLHFLGLHLSVLTIAIKYK